MTTATRAVAVVRGVPVPVAATVRRGPAVAARRVPCAPAAAARTPGSTPDHPNGSHHR
ncbi:hypothetical protein [Streptomyces ossamyceticus]|jgi:hypothetical protein|uniref:hypothetical protein n=1 Tax=Streptomyces ossamyceticus TaxID=249581 RepID=UPI000B15EC88